MEHNVEQFLKDLEDVYQKHGLYISNNKFGFPCVKCIETHEVVQDVLRFNHNDREFQRNIKISIIDAHMNFTGSKSV